MTNPDDHRQAPTPPKPKPDKSGDRTRYDEQLEESFPASDPPADSQPGGGITGPTPQRERGDRR